MKKTPNLSLLERQWNGCCSRRSALVSSVGQSSSTHAMGELRLSNVCLDLECIQYLQTELVALLSSSQQAPHDTEKDQQYMQQQQQQPCPVFESLYLSQCRFPVHEPLAVQQFASLIFAPYIAKRLVLACNMPCQVPQRRGGGSLRNTNRKNKDLSFDDLHTLLLHGVMMKNGSTIESLTFHKVNFALVQHSIAKQQPFLALVSNLLVRQVCDLGFYSCQITTLLAEHVARGVQSRQQQRSRSPYAGGLRTLIVEYCDLDHAETMTTLVQCLDPPNQQDTTTKSHIRQPSCLEALAISYKEPCTELVRLVTHVLQTHDELKCLSLTRECNFPIRTSELYPMASRTACKRELLGPAWKELDQALQRHACLQSLSWPQVLAPTDATVTMVQNRNYWLWRLRNLCKPQLYQKDTDQETTTTTNSLTFALSTTTITTTEDDTDYEGLAIIENNNSNSNNNQAPCPSTSPTTTTTPTTFDHEARSSFVLPTNVWPFLLERVGSSSRGNHCQVGTAAIQEHRDVTSPVFFFLKLHATEFYHRWHQEQEQQH